MWNVKCEVVIRRPLERWVTFIINVWLMRLSKSQATAIPKSQSQPQLTKTVGEMGHEWSKCSIHVSILFWETRVGSRPMSGQPFPAGIAPHAITVSLEVRTRNMVLFCGVVLLLAWPFDDSRSDYYYYDDEDALTCSVITCPWCEVLLFKRLIRTAMLQPADTFTCQPRVFASFSS